MKRYLFLLVVPAFLAYGEGIDASLAEIQEEIQEVKQETSTLESMSLNLIHKIAHLDEQLTETYDRLSNLVAEIARIKEEQQEYLKRNSLDDSATLQKFMEIRNKLFHLEKSLSQQVAEAESQREVLHESINKVGENNVAHAERLDTLGIAMKHLVCDVTDVKATRDALLVTPPIYNYRPDVNKSMGYAGVEFLYWTVYEDGLTYAIKGQVGSPLEPPGLIQPTGSIGTVESIEFDWKPGYRAYLGYCFPPDFWEIEGLYTYFHDKGHSKLHPPGNPGKALVGTFPQFTNTPVEVATSSISLNYNQGDLLLARKFLLTDQLLFRVLFGATGAWVDQHWDYTYQGASVVVGKEDWKFYGGGMRAGLSVDWYLGKGFSFLTKGSGAILAGTFRQFIFNETGNQHVAGAVPHVIEDASLKDHRFTYHTQLAFLPSWGIVYPKWGFLVYAGYELNLWFNLHQIYEDVLLFNRSFDGRQPFIDKGLVGFQGLTAGLKFDF